jgi:hypothetical protein
MSFGGDAGKGLLLSEQELILFAEGSANNVLALFKIQDGRTLGERRSICYYCFNSCRYFSCIGFGFRCRMEEAAV